MVGVGGAHRVGPMAFVILLAGADLVLQLRVLFVAEVVNGRRRVELVFGDCW